MEFSKKRQREKLSKTEFYGRLYVIKTSHSEEHIITFSNYCDPKNPKQILTNETNKSTLLPTKNEAYLNIPSANVDKIIVFYLLGHNH